MSWRFVHFGRRPGFFPAGSSDSSTAPLRARKIHPPADR
jgi:hypothetical protein